MTRDAVFWFSGVGTAIAVNLVSDSDESVKALIATLSVAGAIGGASALRGVDKTSFLRRYAAPVLLTVAVPLSVLAAVLSVLGLGGDSLMMVAAALVAIAVVSTPAHRFVMLAGVCALAAGAAGVVGAWQTPSSSLLVKILMVAEAAGVMVIGGVLLVKGDSVARLLRLLRLHDRMLLLGVIAAVTAVASLVALFRTPGGTAVSLVGIGLAVALLGLGAGLLLPPGRVERIRAGLKELSQARPEEPMPPYGVLVVRCLRRSARRLARLGAVRT